MNKYLLSLYFLVKTFFVLNSEKKKNATENILLSLLVSLVSFFLYYYIFGFYGRIYSLAKVLPNDIFPPYAVFAVILDIMTSLFVKFYPIFKSRPFYQAELFRLFVTYLLFQLLISNMGYFQLTQMINTNNF